MTRQIMSEGWDWESLSYSSDRSEYTDLTESDFAARIEDVDTFFLLVGFPKTATTTIAAILYHHPDIRLPVDKEPFYFNTDEYEFGEGFYWEKYFQDTWNKERVVGEASTANCFIPFVSKRIVETLPDAKIIFSLRNPVDRAFSNWWMYYRSGLENLSFREAVEWEMEEQKEDLMPLRKEDDDYWYWYRRHQLSNRFIRRRTVRTYLMRGYYALHIERFRQYFDDDQLLFVFQDRLYEDRLREMNRIFSFLGLPRVESIETRDAHTAPKHPLHGWVTNNIMEYEDRIPDLVWGAGSKILGLTEHLPGNAEMTAETRKMLLEHYESWNDELEDIVDRDLSSWNNETKY